MLKKKSILLNREFSELSSFRLNYYERQIMFILLSYFNDYEPTQTLSADGSVNIPLTDILRSIVNPKKIKKAKLLFYVRSTISKLQDSIFKTADRRNKDREPVQLFQKLEYNKDFITMIPNVEYVKGKQDDVREFPYIKYDLAPILLITNKYSFNLYKMLEEKKNFSTIYISMNDFLDKVFFDQKETNNMNSSKVSEMLNEVIQDILPFISELSINYRSDLRGEAFKKQIVSINYAPMSKDLLTKLNSIVTALTSNKETWEVIEYKQTQETQTKQLDNFFRSNYGISWEEARKIVEETNKIHEKVKKDYEVEELITLNPEITEMTQEDLNETVLLNVKTETPKKDDDLDFIALVESMAEEDELENQEADNLIENYSEPLESLNKDEVLKYIREFNQLFEDEQKEQVYLAKCKYEKCKNMDTLTPYEKVLYAKHLKEVDEIFDFC